MATLQPLIQEFLDYCEIEKNLSHNTIRLYSHLLKRFLEFAGDISPSKITLELIQKYRLMLNRMPSLSKKVQNYHIISLRSFLRYLIKHDHKTLAPEKIELPKTPERTVEFLTREEVERLFSAVNVKDVKGLRDIAILEMLYSTGLRVSELASLNREQVDLKRREFMVRGKGRKPRIVFLSEKSAKRIEEYLKARKDNYPAIFLNHHGATAKMQSITNPENRRLTTVWIEKLVKRYAMLAGIVKHVTPHTLRHAYATNLLQNGADIRSVQEMLGHSSITTTQIYTHLTNRRLREVHEKFHR